MAARWSLLGFGVIGRKWFLCMEKKNDKNNETTHAKSAAQADDDV